MKKRVICISIIVILLVLGSTVIYMIENKGKRNPEPTEEDTGKTIDETIVKKQYNLVFPGHSIKNELSTNSKTHFEARIDLSKPEWDDIASQLENQGWNSVELPASFSLTDGEKELFDGVDVGKCVEEWNLIRDAELPAKRWVDEKIIVVQENDTSVLILYILFVMPENAE